MSIVTAYIAEATLYPSTVAKGIVKAAEEATRVSPPTETAQKPGRLARLGDFAFRRRRLVLGAWVAALIVAIGAATSLGGDYRADYSTPGAEGKGARHT